MPKEKEYLVDVTVKWTESCSAPNKKEAIEIVKSTFMDEYGIDLTKKEIISVTEVKD